MVIKLVKKINHLQLFFFDRIIIIDIILPLYNKLNMPMKHNYTLLYILDTPENTDELYSFADISTGEKVSGMEGEDPSQETIRRILEYAG